MAKVHMENVESLLERWSQGDESAKNQLVTLLYPELKRVAIRQFSKEKPDHTLQATALLNETYEKLISVEAQWQGKTHFLNLSAKIMRQILVDFARGKQREKRGGDFVRVTLVESSAQTPDEELDIIALDQALAILEQRDPAAASMIEQRAFAGMTNQQIADAQNVSIATVERKIQFAKAWLYKKMHQD
jgi:RNA polymerase sigma factor (TIGR02999 family)